MYTMEMLKLKNTISEVNSLYRNNSRLDTETKGISKLEAQEQKAEDPRDEQKRKVRHDQYVLHTFNRNLKRESRGNETKAISIQGKKRMAVYFTNPKNAKPTDSRTSVSPTWDNFKKNRTRHTSQSKHTRAKQT